MSGPTGQGPLINRYVRYKAGTKQVVQWLARAASRECDLTAHVDGLQLDSEQKFSNAAQTRVHVKTAELLNLAEVVAGADPSISVPYQILIVLQDVINLRQDSADWYASQPASKTGNDGNAYFIKVLKQIHKLLVSSTGPANIKDDANFKNQTGMKEKDELSNLFDCLELEEPSENALGQSAGSDIASKEFECDEFEDDEQDEAFALWCYLEDANEVRKFVRQLWMDYRNGELSLSIAGLSVPLACYIVLTLISSRPILTSTTGSLS